MLTEAWKPLNYHPVQSALWRDAERFKIALAGRGSGKSEVAKRYLVRNLPVTKPWSDPIYAYCLPTLPQAKRVAWEPLKKLIPAEWVKPNGISETDKTIETVFGSKLFLLGLDSPQRAEGVQWDGVIIDESSDVKPGTVERSFLPALSHRNPFFWRIGVPKRFGIGAYEFKTAYEEGLKSGSEYKSYTWTSEEILPPEAITRAKKLLSVEDYREQYKASWEQAGGLIFYSFSDEANISGEAVYNPNLPLIVGSDFNVNPMAWVLCQIHGNKLLVIDELFIRNTNTERTLDTLNNWVQKNGTPPSFIFCGDASGRARKTSASLTDYLLIRNDKRFEPKRVLYPKANPAVQDRFACCNAMLSNAAKEIRLLINPACKYLLNDLRNRAYKEGTREPDDFGDISHSSDALGYVVYRFFPIRIERKQEGSVFIDAA
jgi:hypothetical protein